MQATAPSNPAAQIANMHTLFNVVTTLLLLPLGSFLVKSAMHVLPDRPEDQEEGMRLLYLTPVNANQDRTIGLSAIYISQINQELERMLSMAKANVSTAFQAVLNRDPGPHSSGTRDRGLYRFSQQGDFPLYLPCHCPGNQRPGLCHSQRLFQNHQQS